MHSLVCVIFALSFVRPLQEENYISKPMEKNVDSSTDWITWENDGRKATDKTTLFLAKSSRKFTHFKTITLLHFDWQFRLRVRKKIKLAVAHLVYVNNLSSYIILPLKTALMMVSSLLLDRHSRLGGFIWNIYQKYLPTLGILPAACSSITFTEGAGCFLPQSLPSWDAVRMWRRPNIMTSLALRVKAIRDYHLAWSPHKYIHFVVPSRAQEVLLQCSRSTWGGWMGHVLWALPKRMGTSETVGPHHLRCCMPPFLLPAYF